MKRGYPPSFAADTAATATAATPSEGAAVAEGGAAAVVSEPAGCVVAALMHVGDLVGVAPATVACEAGADDGPHQLALG